jgi:hypothetical protein
MKLLDRLLPKLNERGHRVLIFSQMTQVGAIRTLRSLACDEWCGMAWRGGDGSVC